MRRPSHRHLSAVQSRQEHALPEDFPRLLDFDPTDPAMVFNDLAATVPANPGDLLGAIRCKVSGTTLAPIGTGRRPTLANVAVPYIQGGDGNGCIGSPSAALITRLLAYDLTVVVWEHVSVFPTAIDEHIFGFHPDGSADGAIRIDYQWSSGGDYRARKFAGSASSVTLNGPAFVMLNTWHMGVMRCHPNFSFDLWINAVRGARSVNTNAPATTHNRLALGIRSNGSASAFLGRIGRCVVFDGVLTPVQLAALRRGMLRERGM